MSWEAETVGCCMLHDFCHIKTEDPVCIVPGGKAGIFHMITWEAESFLPCCKLVFHCTVRSGNMIFDNVSICQSCALIPKARNQLETILGSFSEDIYSRETEGSEIEKKNTGMLRNLWRGNRQRGNWRGHNESGCQHYVENSCINWAQSTVF